MVKPTTDIIKGDIAKEEVILYKQAQMQSSDVILSAMQKHYETIAEGTRRLRKSGDMDALKSQTLLLKLQQAVDAMQEYDDLLSELV